MTRRRTAAPRLDGVFDGPSRMAALMRAHDWNCTPLGPVAAWPQSLKSALSICLSSRFPIVIYWGPELTVLYNDAYSQILAGKHPWALGRACRECWAEIWDVIGPMLANVMATGEATWSDDLLLFLERNGYPEECYFSFSFSPVQVEGGGFGGVFTAVTETTGRVLGERRLATLGELAARASEGQSTAESCRRAAETLARNPKDSPFALLYVLDRDLRVAELAGCSGLAAGGPASPSRLELAEGGAPWPVAAVARLRTIEQVDGLGERHPGLFDALAPAPRTALVLPIERAGDAHPYGVLVAGLSPHRPFDEQYRRYLELVAGNVATSLANARAGQEARERAEQLAALDRAKTAFFSNVSHEFRTPLTLMLGPLEDMVRGGADGFDPVERHEQLALVHRNGLRLLKLVNTLLDFSRLEAGRAEACYEPTNLARLTADLAAIFRSAAERAGLRLHVECPALAEPVYVDREMWEKVVLNLLSNALKFTLEGEITVRLSGGAEGAELSVHDSGSGIPEQEIPHLFERFHRVRGARARTHEGSGIGLAMVHELVRLHGGTVRVESALGRGSTFSIRLPFGSAHLPPHRIGARAQGTTALGAELYLEEALRWLSPTAAPPSLPDGARSGLEEAAGLSRPDIGQASARILLADDNADMRAYVTRVLGQYWEVEPVPDGRAALQSAQRAVPDLVLADMMMPGLDGFALLRELRARRPTREVPVVVLSARAGEESKVEGLEAGANDYLVKPFSARELVARVGAQLQIARIRRAALATEQHAREEAEQANRLKDEFLATLSHELRAPLNAIVGWAYVLRSLHPELPKVAEAAARIEKSAETQARLLEDVLDVSRIITGKLVLKVDTVDLETVVEQALDSVRVAAQAKNIAIEVDLAPVRRRIRGDAARLQQIVWNLLANAVKFTPRGGHVRVQTRTADGDMELAVSDDGIGISPEFLPHVFERFRQADSSTTRAHQGLGLGLAIVRHLAELHGGTVEAESRGRGQGATLRVRLPLESASAVHPSETTTPSVAGICAVADVTLISAAPPDGAAMAAVEEATLPSAR